MVDAAYPAENSVDIALRDGSTVHVRPVSVNDHAPLREFLGSLSEHSLYLRGLGHMDVEWLCDWSLDVDYRNRYGLVVSTGLDPRIVGHGAYVRLDAHSAEVAFEVADSRQGKGIATALLGQLAAVAARHGITEFIATTLPENRRMIDVFEDSGFEVDSRPERGELHFKISTETSKATELARERRHHTTSLESVRPFLEPEVVAVIGASRDPRSVGALLLHNLLSTGFQGQVHPVNPRADQLMGRRCWASVLDVPDRVDLAVIAVPAARVADVARECATARVRALLVLSSGFAESGGEGIQRQEELLKVCREGGMRLVGPNCLGIVNNDPSVRLNASFAERVPPPGPIALMSQSGGVAIALAEVAARLSIGVSSFVSVGNKVDISGNDLLEYWEEDPTTELIALYLESFGDPRRFARLARRIGAQKPILAVKSGRTPAGSRAASSHTAALLSASDVTVDALFRQAGVIRSDTLGELLDTAALIATQPLPRGSRVGIVTNGGGPGIMCADDCQSAGLDVVEFPESLRATLTSVLPEHSAVHNPIDMTSAATAEHYRQVVELLAADRACDAIIALFVPTLATAVEDLAQELDRVATDRDDEIPVAAVFVGRDPEDRRGRASRMLTAPQGAARYPLPEDAVRALRHAVEYVRWRDRPAGTVVEPEDDADRERARGIIAEALRAGDEWLKVADAFALLDCYGIPHVPTITVTTVEEAVAFGAACERGIALKAIAPGLLHKSDVGAVRLGLRDEEAIREAAGSIEHATRAHGITLSGFVAQEMAPTGVELLVGVVDDPSFGPVVACGAGGTVTELLGDVAVRITPVTDVDAAEQLRSLRTFPLLDGYRGAPRCDIEAVEHLLTAVSALVDHHPEIAELDLNPLIATPAGALVTDARVRVREPAQKRPPEALRG